MSSYVTLDEININSKVEKKIFSLHHHYND